MAKGKVAALQREIMAHRMVEDVPVERDVDLRAEMLANGIDYAGCQRLEALGVSGRFVCGLSAALAIGAARVSVGARSSLWELEGPDARLLLACFDEGGLCDIAAVSTSHPDQVAMRTGDGWCLGFDRIEDAERAALAERRVRLRVFADPLEWLRGDGEGIVVLDWAAALPRLRMLGERVTLECDRAMASVVKARLERGGLPLVAVGAPDDAAMSLAEKLGRAA